jgi:curved DNA-binding protein CbpA
MAQLNHYQILQVDYEAVKEEIRAAYLLLLRACRDDPQRRQDVARAYSVLSDPVLRLAHDRKINVRYLIQEQRQRRGPAPRKRKPWSARPKTEILSGGEQQPDPDVTGPHKIRGVKRDPTLILEPDAQPEEQIKLEEPPPEQEPEPSKPIDRTRLRVSEPEPEPAPAAFLEVIFQDNSRRKQPLNLDKTTIGRAEDSDIYFDDPEKYVSRKHAYIIVKSGRYYLVDSDSCNGTWMGGKRLSAGEEVALNEGDEFEIEERRLIVHFES